MNPLYYFVLALTTVLAVNADGPVYDTDGDIIFDGSYYVLPLFRGGGGGLTLASRIGQVCPLNIVQESSEVDDGLPVKFSNWQSKVAFVPLFENLNIETQVAATICSQSTFWQVTEFDNIWQQSFVIAGSKPEGYGEDSLKSFFKIQKAGSNAYMFMYCPGNEKCKYVGIYIDERRVRRLVLRNNPFMVVFKKAKVNELSAKTM